MGKNKTRRSQIDFWQNDSDDDYYGSSYSSTSGFKQAVPGFTAKPLVIKARNPRQEQLLNLLEDNNIPIVIATGPAGCGKTHLASLVGMKKLVDGIVERIIITRPAVSVDEDHGFLPGTLEEKMDPWMRPIYDSFHHFFPPKKVQSMIDDKTIEICPLAYARGRTFDNAWVIGDEMQNATSAQTLMFLTRIGANSKMIVTGDLAQSDLGCQSGLADLIKRIEKKGSSSDIQSVHFHLEDVERHPAIKHVLRLYKD